MSEINIYNDINEVLSALAEAICTKAKLAIAERGQFNFVLAGGNSPKKLYELLASEKFKSKIDWDKTFFFFGDERYVPENDPQRNSMMVQKALFVPLKIKDSHVFKVDTSKSPEAAASNYNECIKSHFGDKKVEFDFVLLGLGDNAHTASLFPNTTVLKETAASAKSVYVEEVSMWRITMTAPLINQARAIAFLVYGKDKAEAVYHVLKDLEGSINEHPARLISTDKDKTQWYIDTEAASKLN
ncbi:6-phosphogluconolactonase [Flavobacterium weaverense]|uniref:6-phosphogluconolactonase n=1 Tax=Flavobacterium weaverense TaxID=271156 RepID=A0A3L9ZU04_9FLAO|nr:6-phosphogluconolactonase [Flavobacterium weaverense]RMA76173.1 6-phosphogluconolactonase [Flavobacterium weaverense]